MNPATYTRGSIVAPNTPSNSGGTVVSYSVSPGLPAGLSLDSATGIVSGTPTAVTATATYVVTATNSGGSATVNLIITVNDVPPSDLIYDSNPAVYVRGVAITPNTPSTGGGPASYSVSPVLPAGLSLNATTGVISGTPTAVTATATYVVRAENSGGSATVELIITVNDVPPSDLTYDPNPAVYVRGVAITPNTPSIGGGPVVSFSVSPVLPDGLSLDPATGVISGTPTAVTAQANYVVTATNSGGSTTANLSITVNSSVQAVAAGRYHTCALVNGGVQCWGSNSNGQLGNDSTSESHVPVAVSGLAVGAQSLAPGGWHTCALVNDGVKCWGMGAQGQLGNGSTADSLVPVGVSGLTSGVQAIAAGFLHACALVDGGVRCWGANYYGQLGNDSPGDSSTPVDVQGLTSGAQAIAAGLIHTCAIVNGGVQCWGNNDSGQLGNNSTTGSPVPVAVSGLESGVRAIAAGGGHNCAIVSGGTQCWGANSYGQLGNDSTTASPVPVAVSGLESGVQSIAAGGEHTCALVSGGIQCWGLNGNGQLGNDSTTDSHVPVGVAASWP